MFKKTINFKDFDGNPQTGVFYFHISKAELLAMSANGDEMQARIRRIIAEKDGAKILNEYRELIKLAVGIRSEDGQRFVKDEASQSILLDSPAFDELLMELATDAEAASDFVQQLLPEKMQKEMIDQLRKSNSETETPEDTRPAYQKEHRHPRQNEFASMSTEELAEAMAWVQRNNPSKP